MHCNSFQITVPYNICSPSLHVTQNNYIFKILNNLYRDIATAYLKFLIQTHKDKTHGIRRNSDGDLIIGMKLPIL